jgi:hypothetical protein
MLRCKKYREGPAFLFEKSPADWSQGFGREGCLS